MKNIRTARAVIEIDASIAKVWEALTTPQLIKQYFFGTDVVSGWKVGDAITFSGEWNGQQYQDKGAILNIIPLRLFRYNYWSSMSGIPDKTENYVVITYSLFENDNKALLTVTQENIPDDEMKAHAEDNWKTVLDKLKYILEKAYQPV
ncbi:SRPBCC family protein [Ferruginibacter profundus]